MKVARLGATTMAQMKIETGTMADLMWQPMLTLASALRRGRELLIVLVASLIHQPSALATPAVTESLTGAGRRRGRMRHV